MLQNINIELHMINGHYQDLNCLELYLVGGG